MSVEPEAPKANSIVLPSDKPVRLFILAMAMHFCVLKITTKIAYELEVANQEIESLSNLPRDVHRARVRDLAARKRHYGALENIPNESIRLSPFRWQTLVIGLFIFFGVVAYGQYSGQLGGWIAGVTSYAGYLVVVVLIVLALLLIAMTRLRRRKGNLA